MPDPLDTYGQSMHNFLRQVTDRAPAVGSDGEAEQITRGTLSALAKAVSSGQYQALTASLPPELQSDADQSDGQARSMDKAAFIDTAGAASSSSDPEVVEKQVRAVLHTVVQHEPHDQVDDALAQLPQDLRALFTA